MSSPESYTPEQKRILLDIARDSIAHGVETGRALRIDPGNYPAALQQPRATFVTLKLDERLRGCIGMLEAQRALVDDVAHNAWAAAFSDPRFPPVSRREAELLSIHISVLSPSQDMTFVSETDLLRQLRPGIDGLILEEGARYRGTFLPTVWESLPEPREFLRHLKQKAGLPDHYWSETLKVRRYTTESIE